MRKFLTKFSNCEIIGADKLLHFTFEFMFTAFLLIFLNLVGIRTHVKIYLIIFVFLLAFAKEIFDKYYKINGSWCWYDIIYGVLGGLLFVFIYDLF